MRSSIQDLIYHASGGITHKNGFITFWLKLAQVIFVIFDEIPTTKNVEKFNIRFLTVECFIERTFESLIDNASILKKTRCFRPDASSKPQSIWWSWSILEKFQTFGEEIKPIWNMYGRQRLPICVSSVMVEYKSRGCRFLLIFPHSQETQSVFLSKFRRGIPYICSPLTKLLMYLKFKWATHWCHDQLSSELALPRKHNRDFPIMSSISIGYLFTFIFEVMKHFDRSWDIT